jgi:selenocysteine-specific elongation factor
MKSNGMRYVVAGTAGHIDHGKTSLVRALTGVDTDRLKEEKQRGISIDLGFAHMALSPECTLAFVDVPGHERFVKNMVAGATGIDFVVMVIAADESIKPQTREHFDICRLLGVARGIVVLTKCDLVDKEILDLVRLEVEEFVKGSFLEHAPVVAVSAITQTGLQELRQTLLEVAMQVPARPSQRYFRLPVDRSFSMRGFGTVVTGTLVSGAIATGDEADLLPGAVRLRVRGLQVDGEAVEKAYAGQRTAVNLSGIEAGQVRRGMTLAAPGRFAPTTRIDCSFDLLAGAKPLKPGAPVHFHSGTAETEATIRRLGSREPIRGGEKTWVRLRLREPLLLLPGDRFIVRMFSPVVTIGGGEVVDAEPPRKSTPERAQRLREAAPAERLSMLVAESRAGTSLSDLVRRTGWREEEIRAAAGKLKRIAAAPEWFVVPAWFEERGEALAGVLKEFHRANPLQTGMSKEEARAQVLAEAPAFVFEALLGESEDAVAEGDTVRLKSHRVALAGDEEAAQRKIEEAFERAGLAVPSTQEVLAGTGIDPARSRTLLQILLRQQSLVKVSEDLIFHRTALDSLRGLLAARRGARFQVGEFKQWTGVSRKYAIPLLEFLDRQRLTRREGDSRVIL